ncbi:MAG TPA: hypothetical protein DDX92_13720 [Flavobacteriales bacterium]|jgi:hypothetical protein|nr:hypothetical protein [Flavobacteriales bacterium]
MKSISKTFLIICTLGISSSALGQTDQSDNSNVITTAVPFLTITPDARHGAMAGVGAATSPDVFDNAHNPAKLAFAEDQGALAFSYTPWLGALVQGINLSYVSGYYKIDKLSTVGASLRYFTLGDIQFTNENGDPTIQHRPNEFSIDGAYSRKLADRFSMSISLRFIYSNLTGGTSVSNAQTKPGLAVASDIYAYYQNDDIEIGEKDATLAFGSGISNIGNKMTYSNLDEDDFLPMNFKIGGNLTLHLDDYNDISFMVDMNKLLVPTPPIYNSATGEIIAGRDPNRTVASSIITSWYDAPGTLVTNSIGEPILDANGMAEAESGSVLREELRELYFGFGFEYWYNKLFAARAGYFAEHATKGNRKYLTFGIGVKYNIFTLDMSYLVPLYVGNQQFVGTSPLANTIQFSLGFIFSGEGKSSSSGSEGSF